MATSLFYISKAPPPFNNGDLKLFNAIWGSLIPIEQDKVNTQKVICQITQSLLQNQTKEELIRSRPFIKSWIEVIQDQAIPPSFSITAYPKEPYSRIQETAERQLFALVQTYLDRKSEMVKGLQKRSPDPFCSAIQKIENISLFNPEETHKGECFDYAFEDQKSSSYLPYLLNELGWESVLLSACKQGDIVGYFDYRDTKEFPRITLWHVGIVHEVKNHQIWVRSKFGSLDVMLHEVSVVPRTYGDAIVCLRKTDQSIQVSKT